MRPFSFDREASRIQDSGLQVLCGQARRPKVLPRPALAGGPSAALWGDLLAGHSTHASPAQSCATGEGPVYFCRTSYYCSNNERDNIADVMS
jgi:hypothetical protein